MKARSTVTHPPAVAESLAAIVSAMRADALPGEVCEQVDRLLVDVVGLCFAARNADYVQAVKRALDERGVCTAIGHAGTLAAEDAALLNGTAAHGEDFDDTFEGGPVHSGAVIVPAVLAACERFACDGPSARLGIAVGVEALCRLALVKPKAIHNAGFHPTGVLGTLAASVGVAAALGAKPEAIVDALGIAGSTTGGIIEYLTDGASTKRMHAGSAARGGVQAARLAMQGFSGPRTVLEGTHGVFRAFTHGMDGDFSMLTEGFGERWRLLDLTFKPYATGTMNQPYIDCARRLAARGIDEDEILDVVCETSEGYVARLWEPIDRKCTPPNAYAAKFSAPFNVAVGFIRGEAGLAAFSEETVRDPRILALARKVRYVVDPANPYPARYTGHVRMTLRDGRVVEERQPHIRGGVHEPLSRADLERKFLDNAHYGSVDASRARRLLEHLKATFDGPLDLAVLRG
ncbi:MAG TPA: MmgE/PrpD family protein [Casimicrobiaceae bacterium]|nr:MmgE/PrpD family protein [Casimicrobiaceae bacterium]